MRYFIIVVFLSCAEVAFGQTYETVMRELSQYEVFTLESAIVDPDSVIRLKVSKQDVESDLLNQNIGAFVNLRELVLSDTYISELPSNIGILAKLESLEIQHLEKVNNNLTKLPDSFKELRNLVSLNLIGNPNLDWEEAAQTLASLPSLENLALMNNSFEFLPRGIIQCKSLRMIWLGQNAKLRLPDTMDDLSNLTNLEQLGLGGGEFKVLPNEIRNLKNVKNLWLSGNPWKSIRGIDKMPSLRAISLNNCSLKKLPSTIGNCKGLAYLSIKGNLELDPKSIIEKIPSNLKTIVLPSNAFKELIKELQSEYPELKIK